MGWFSFSFSNKFPKTRHVFMNMKFQERMNECMIAAGKPVRWKENEITQMERQTFLSIDEQGIFRESFPRHATFWWMFFFPCGYLGFVVIGFGFIWLHFDMMTICLVWVETSSHFLFSNALPPHHFYEYAFIFVAKYIFLLLKNVLVNRTKGKSAAIHREFTRVYELEFELFFFVN